MDREEKQTILQIIITTLLIIVSFIIPGKSALEIGILLVAYLIIGREIVFRAASNAIKGKLLDENFLMTIATIGAIITGEYIEAVLVMLLYQIGELFQDYAVGKSRKSITNLMDIRPDYANVKRKNKLEKVTPEQVKVGDLIVIKPGEKIPLDGIIKEGESMIDTSSLTGESIPQNGKVGMLVFSGCINKSGVLIVEVTKKFAESTVSKILDLVENASNKKAKTEKFITKFARYYTPIVVISAIILAVFPPLFQSITWNDSIQRAMTFLVISCPCALVISIPLSFFGGIGGASKHGILIKGSNYLEALTKVNTIVFDKTGTLTKGNFKVAKIKSNHYSQKQLLEYAALVEVYSIHPIAEAIRSAYSKEIDSKRISHIKEYAGKGIEAIVDNKKIIIGNRQLMEMNHVLISEDREVGTVVHVAIDGKYEGSIFIADEIKKEAKETIKRLKSNHVNRIVMLTGDSEKTASQVAQQLNIESYYSQLLPQDKVKRVECLLKESNEKKLCFVGDGINDAPVLSIADVGIAMGGLGSDAAIEAADIVIMDDDLSKINDVIHISKKTIKIVKQNIVFALGIKVLFLILGALGFANMMEAVFADVGVSIIAILNSMRTLTIYKKM